MYLLTTVPLRFSWRNVRFQTFRENDPNSKGKFQGLSRSVWLGRFGSVGLARSDRLGRSGLVGLAPSVWLGRSSSMGVARWVWLGRCGSVGLLGWSGLGSAGVMFSSYMNIPAPKRSPHIPPIPYHTTFPTPIFGLRIFLDEYKLLLSLLFS